MGVRPGISSMDSMLLYFISPSPVSMMDFRPRVFSSWNMDFRLERNFSFK